MKLLFAFVPILFLFSCQSDATQGDALGNGAPPIVKKKVEALKVEEGCQFISNADIADILGINAASIKLRPPQQDGNYSVCMWSWTQNGKRQSLYLRSERNPNIKKHSQKFDNFLNFSLKNGEKRYLKDGKDEKITFKEIKNLGDKAIWSDQGRILKWHYKNQFLFTLGVDRTNSINDAEKDFATIKRLSEMINRGIDG